MAEVDRIWLDYTIENNENGVLKVLDKYGYIGYLAPQSIEDVQICAYEIIHKYGDQGVIDLLQAHPEFEAFKELFESETEYPKRAYNNAIGGIGTRVESFVSKLRPVNQAFVALGVFVATYYILQQVKN